jgi:chromosome segregation ATPase
MGWGICFDLDANGQVFCRDGCRWRATARDYEDFVPWPSAREQVLDYFEGEAHSELDMIRDECPGTASALAEACEEHLGAAFNSYHRLSAAEKIEMHETKMKEFTEDLEELKEQIDYATEQYKQYKKAFKDLKPSTKPPKTRADELHDLIGPLQAELAMELAATRVDGLTRTRANIVKQLNKEKKFVCEE